MKGGMLPLLKLNKMKLRKLTTKDEFLKLDGLVNDKMVNELIEENCITETTSPEIPELITLVHTPKPTKIHTMIKYSEIESIYIGSIGVGQINTSNGEFYYPNHVPNYSHTSLKKIKDAIAKFMSGEYEIHSIGNYVCEIVLGKYACNVKEYGVRMRVRKPIK